MPELEVRMSAVEAATGEFRMALARIEGTLGGLSATVASIDDRLRTIETQALPKIGADIARLDGRVSELPTTTAIFTYMGGLMTLTLAIGGVCFVIARATLGH